MKINLPRIVKAQLLSQLSEPEEETCSFCGHEQGRHKETECFGFPLVPDLDAGGDCPCQGFEKRERN